MRDRILLEFLDGAKVTFKCFLLLQGKYRLGRKIGSGSFGDIYIGEGKPSDLPLKHDVHDQVLTLGPSLFVLLQERTCSQERRLGLSW